MSREASLFDGDSSSMLLLLDRREDPVTPLLTQWTYQVETFSVKGLSKYFYRPWYMSYWGSQTTGSA